MRKYRFRVWDKKRNEWVSAQRIGVRGDTGELIFLFINTVEWEYPDEPERYVKTMYTDYLDENKSEVCEGDVIEVIIDRILSYYGVVEYENGQFFINCRARGDETWYTPSLTTHIIKRIGNIFENPELKKKLGEQKS